MLGKFPADGREADLQHAELSGAHLPDVGVVVAVCESLDGHRLSRRPVDALEHLAVRAFPDLVQPLVLVHGGPAGGAAPSLSPRTPSLHPVHSLHNSTSLVTAQLVSDHRCTVVAFSIF